MHKTLVTLAVALTTFVCGCSDLERSRNLADPSVSAKTLAEQVCSNCHGLDGNSVSPAFPHLAAQQPDYIVSQLNNFRGHQRIDPEGYQYMWGLSRHLSDEQITGLAQYYAKQVARRSTEAAVDAKQLAAGKELFEKGVPDEGVVACMTCHGPRAQGMASFPRLAFQHADYIVKQLDVFQNTEGRPGTPMNVVAHSLTAANKLALAAYLQALPE